MNKLIGRRVVVRNSNFLSARQWTGMVGTIVEVHEYACFKIQLTFHGYDSRPVFGPEELRYLNNKPVVLS